MTVKEQQEIAAHTPGAAQETPFEEMEANNFWDNDLENIPEYYVKVSTMISDRSDVTLLLGNTYRESGTRIDLCKLRLIMSHHAFLEFAEDIRKQAAFLTKLYKGNIPGPSFTSEEFDLALEELELYDDD